MQRHYQTRLKGQVVAVTGATSGIGRAVALEAASQGATVLLLARRTELLTHLAQQCENLAQSPAYPFTVDLADRQAIETTVEKISSTTPHVDILVNCAGYGQFEWFRDMTVADIESLFKVNTIGTILLTRLMVPLMFDRGGHIINIGSMAGKLVTPKTAIYAASKAALIAVANGLRIELKPLGINVTTVNPGPVDTPFFEHADKTGEYLKHISWLALDPVDLAVRIVAIFNKPVRELNLPHFMALAARLYPLMPSLGDRLIERFGDQK